ncbi:HNH endonuclease [Bdellovibrio sp. HCB290]|uniref:HNH endonuclease n=1 Tax=Bdellovibrio sp. HCB290 TaxID=3394356 RepID=UPI0039B44C1D
MNLKTITNEELTGRLEKLAHSERKITHLVLIHINEMESRRLYAELGFDSMFRYLTRHLKYSEDAAYRRLSAARLLKQSPSISKKIENGSITLTQLTQVQSALKLEQKNNPHGADTLAITLPTILEKIENKSAFETKACLAKDFNLPVVTHDSITPQSDETIRFEITLTREQLKTLETVRDLTSHIVPDGNWADVLTLIAEKHIQKILGKDKPEFTANSTPISSPKPATGSDQQNSTHGFLATRKRGHIKVTAKRNLLLNANYCCEFQNPNTGVKCGSKYQLQIDHIQPVALGGLNENENLRVLCRTHNLAAAEKLGLKTH